MRLSDLKMSIEELAFVVTAVSNAPANSLNSVMIKGVCLQKLAVAMSEEEKARGNSGPITGQAELQSEEGRDVPSGPDGEGRE